MRNGSPTLACLAIALTLAIGACLENSGPQSGSLHGRPRLDSQFLG